MRFLRFAALAVASASVVYACSSSSTSGIAKDSGATGDVGVPPAEGGGYCCPPDPEPSCDMYYGGYSATASCEQTADGMPTPNDPSWKLTTDSHGCKIWTSTLSPTSTICGTSNDGASLADSGSALDSGSDASSGDAGSFDASPE